MPYKDPLKNQAYQREWQRKRHIRDKKIAVDMLGGKCVRCEIDNIIVLQFDHIKPVLRKEPQGSVFMVRQIVAGKVDLSTLQVLCANCHAIKTYKEDRILNRIY